VIWGWGSPVNMVLGHKKMRPPVAVMRAPVILLLLVGQLIDPVQLRHLGAFPGHNSTDCPGQWWSHRPWRCSKNM